MARRPTTLCCLVTKVHACEQLAKVETWHLCERVSQASCRRHRIYEWRPSTRTRCRWRGTSQTRTADHRSNATSSRKRMWKVVSSCTPGTPALTQDSWQWPIYSKALTTCSVWPLKMRLVRENQHHLPNPLPPSCPSVSCRYSYSVLAAEKCVTYACFLNLLSCEFSVLAMFVQFVDVLPIWDEPV